MPRLGEASLSSAPPPYWRKPLNSSRGRCGLRAPRSLLRALAGGSVCVVSCDRGSAGRAVDADSFRDGSDSLVSGRGAAGKGDSLGRSRQSGEAGFDGADGPWGRLVVWIEWGSAGRGSLRALRTDSASTLRMASSKARRSRVISASERGG